MELLLIPNQFYSLVFFPLIVLVILVIRYGSPVKNIRGDCSGYYKQRISACISPRQFELKHQLRFHQL